MILAVVNAIYAIAQEPEKKIRFSALQRDLNPWRRNTGATL